MAAVVAAGSCPPFVMAVAEVGPREGEVEAGEAGAEAGEEAGEEVEEVAWEQQSVKLQRFAVLKSV